MPTSKAESGFDVKRLRELRLAAGLTQIDLAGRAGVNNCTICKYEKGNARPRASVLELIWKALAQAQKERFYAEKVRPLMRSIRSTLDGSISLTCPHCQASSITYSDAPGVEYKCLSCSRSFRANVRGQAYIPAPPAGRGEKHGVMSDEARANISAGQRKRHAEEREAERRERAEEGL